MLRFIDGFDCYATGDISLKWSQVNTNFSQPNISSSGRYGSGTQSLSNGDSAGFVAKTLPSLATYIIGMAIKITSMASQATGVGSTIVVLYDDTNPQVDLRINRSGLLVISRNGTTLATGTTTMAQGVWYYIEFMATIGSSISANTCIARIGGVNEIVLASGSNTKSTGNSTANSVRFTGINGGALIDDIYICDTTGSVNNAFLGDVRVECLRPTADGTSTAFTPNTGTNHAAVAQTTQDGDTTYNASNTIGNIDTFGFGSLSSSPTNICAVQTTMVARKDDAGSRSIAPLVRHSGTDYVGGTVGLPDSYVYSSEIRETNPATSAAWAASEVNSLEAGYKLVG